MKFLPSQKSIKKYEPNYILKAGMRVWIEMLEEVVNNRELIWRLIVRDISVKYKQSIIGIFWAFLAPLTMMVICIWVKSRGIVSIGDTVIPYAAYVFLGQMVWYLFSQGITVSSGSLVGASSLLTKINFPKEVLVLAALGQTIFEFLVRVPLLILIFFLVGFCPSATFLLIPFAILPLLLMIVGLGYLLSLFNAVIRDIGSVLGIGVTLGLFVTPVFYPPPVNWPIAFLINQLNPVSGFVTAVQDLTARGYLTDPSSYLSSVLVSMLIFFAGWRVFHLVEPKIAERV
jgi:lipopolysaccharide transport system permease protein